MKKSFKFAAFIMSACILMSSCIGSFSATNKLKDWNDGIGDKFVNELVFIGLHIIPVYELFIFADILVLNSIEFWTGDNLVSNSGETKIVKNANGENVTITSTDNGYNLSNGETAMNLIFDEAENTWSVEYNNQVNKLMKITGENSAELFLVNGETMNVTGDNMDAVRQIIIGNYAMK